MLRNVQAEATGLVSYKRTCIVYDCKISSLFLQYFTMSYSVVDGVVKLDSRKI